MAVATKQSNTDQKES